MTSPPTAQDCIDVYIRAQQEVIADADAPLRQGAGPVHDTRVAIRRLRSTLRVFAPIFQPSAAAALEAELTWYAGLLGAVRDREVMRLRLADAVGALPSGLVLGPVAEHIDQHLHSELTFHHQELTRAMDGDRYRGLLTTLGEWVDSPPYATVAEEETVVRMAKKAAQKAKLRLSEAHSANDAATALHRARKAAKRARYGAELIEPLGTQKAAARVRHFKHVQSVLGTYQDSVITADLLRRLGAGAGTLPGHNGFTYGLLYDRELHARQAALAEVATL